MKLLLDTHVWVWSMLEPQQIGEAARDAITDAGASIHLSSITFWEVALLIERGRIVGEQDAAGWIDYALREYPVTELAIDRQIALESRRMQLAHQDPADRFIAATARLHGLTLVTRDERLLTATGLSTIAA